MKNLTLILGSLLVLAPASFSEVMGSSGSHGSSRGINGFNGSNGGFNNGFNNGMNNGMNGFGGGGFGGMGGGMGGMGGGGGGAQYKPNSDPKAFDPSKPNESTKKIEESTKQFSQSAEKLQQSFMSSLDKLTPEDNTADLLKELNESAERYSSLGSSGQSSGEIVDGITKQITENAKTIEEQWKVAATPWTTPKSQPAVPEGTSTAQRIGGLQSSNRQSNPLAVAMGAEPAAQHSSSIPESVPSGSYGFFKGAKPYNAPQTPRK